jgi:LPPG:FO 2-phospho-L-lactate transferase
MDRHNRRVSSVVILAGGTGGAKLARGMLDVVGDDLVVVANTADDVEIYGAYVSPDPDLCAFWLADRIDDRGWGLDGDSFNVMDGLRELGVDVWFNLGDRDLALGVERARRLAAGERLTEAHGALMAALGVRIPVLPMADEPVRTEVTARGRTWPFQEFMIRERAEGPIEDVRFAGADAARATPEVLDAIGGACAIVIGPSNPVISIGPILAVPGVRDALAAAAAPVVAVSPVVGGQILKGPTRQFLEWAGQEVSAAGVAAAYDGLLDAIVADENLSLPTLPVLRTDTLMDDAQSRARLAGEVLAFADALRDR